MSSESKPERSFLHRPPAFSPGSSFDWKRLNYQKNGITGNELGTTVTISGNTVVGQGPTNGAAENSIQISFGGTGQTRSNPAVDNIWAPDTISDSADAASGILVFASAGVTVSGNTIGNNQFG